MFQYTTIGGFVQDFVELSVKFCDLPGLFAVARGESADTPRKPDPTGLLRTIEELGSAPERTAYVGDSTGDIAVSRNAGTYAVAVTWGYHGAERLRAASADLVIDDPRALLDLLG